MIYLLCIIIVSLGIEQSKAIPGPKKTDRIAIIGAGPAGVHMAYKLKKSGFNKVTIYEKSNRIGGKSLSIQYGGVRHEMGTCFLSADYKNIVGLVDDFNAGKIVGYTERLYWLNKTDAGTSLEYLIHATGITDPAQLMGEITTKGYEYIALHQRLFGDYEGTLMPRPSISVLNEIQGTFSEFLQRNNLTILEAVFAISYTYQGYGYLNRTAALYGLMWVTPKVVQAVLDPTAGSMFAIDEGYQRLWEKMVLDFDIDVKFGVDIKKIRRPGIFNVEKILIDYKYGFTGIERRAEADFLVITPSMNSLMDVVDFRLKERCKFSKLTEKSYFVTTLVESEPGIRFGPLNFYVYGLTSPPDYDVWGSADNYAALSNITGYNYTQGLTQGADYCTGCQTAVLYQYGETNPWRQEIRRGIRKELRKHLLTFQLDNGRIINQQTWDYFNRFSQRDIEDGILWEILDMQGYLNTWYAGASVSFESAEAVVSYNNLLFHKAGLDGTK